jgi:heme exporter protein D
VVVGTGGFEERVTMVAAYVAYAAALTMLALAVLMAFSMRRH